MRKLIIMFLIMSCFCIISYSKYVKEFELEAIQIITDNEAPTYKISYNNKSFTNKDVEIKIIFSEEIQGLQGFQKVNDFTYKKTLKENKKEKLEVFDLAGNNTQVEYNVNWIDKVAPQIIGINNNEIYYETKKVQYKDNLSGIKNIEKIFHGDLDIGIVNFIKNENYYEITIRILRKPKNCRECKVLKTNVESKQISNIKNDFITYRIPVNENFEIYAEAIDNSNKKYSSEKININNIEKFMEKNKKYNNEDLNTFSNPGCYEIKVTDNADNQTIYTIKVEK